MLLAQAVGATVLATPDADEALRILRGHKSRGVPVHVLLADHHLDGQRYSGLDVLGIAQREALVERGVLVSGDADAEEYLLRSGRGHVFLPKPVDPDVLVRAVRA